MSDVLRSGFSEGRAASVAPPSLGLVSLETSFSGVHIDPVRSRLNRMRSSVRTAARLHESEVSALPVRYRSYFLTLTYRPGVEWSPKHISDCLAYYRRWAAVQKISLRYVWVAEIQSNRYQNGALLGECVHYHVLLFVPFKSNVPKPDKSGYWPHGMTQVVAARKPVAYLTKYATKAGDAFFPKGLRTHGCGGLSSKGRSEKTWWGLPRWVRVLFDFSEVPRRVRGGFVSRVTGRCVQTLWSVLRDGRDFYFWLRNDLSSFLSPFQLWQLAIAGVIPEKWGGGFENAIDESFSVVSSDCPF